MSTPGDATKRPLPNGWRWVKLGEVCEIIAGQSPPSETYSKFPEGLPFFQGKADFGFIHPLPRVWCTEPKVIAKPGDILISVRAPVGPTNIADIECCIGRGLAAIRPQKDVNRDFILLALKLSEPVLVKLGSGSTFQAIKREDLEGLEIPLPPLAEQQRIAAVLREQMAAVERARRAAEEQLEAAKALPAALLRQIFPRPSQPLPDGWRWVKLGEVCEIYQPQTISLEEIARNPGPYPVFGANGVIGWYKEYNHAEPEVLVTCRGATCGSVNFSKPKSWITGNAMVVKPRASDFLAREFLYWALKGSDFSSAMGGSAQPQITRQTLVPFEIPLPPVEEQQRIAAKLREQMASVERARRALEEQLEAINKLPAAILQKAFNGQL